jgi:hypothetical protein
MYAKIPSTPAVNELPHLIANNIANIAYRVVAETSPGVNT